jgi:hypothetical protein
MFAFVNVPAWIKTPDPIELKDRAHQHLGLNVALLPKDSAPHPSLEILQLKRQEFKYMRAQFRRDVTRISIVNRSFLTPLIQSIAALEQLERGLCRLTQPLTPDQRQTALTLQSYFAGNAAIFLDNLAGAVGQTSNVPTFAKNGHYRRAGKSRPLRALKQALYDVNSRLSKLILGDSSATVQMERH